MKTEFDIISFLENNNILFKGPNRRGFIELIECPYCGAKKKLNICVDRSGDGVRYGFAKCFKCGEPGSFHKIISTVQGITENQALAIYLGGKKRKEAPESPFAIEDFIPKIEMSDQKIKKELQIGKLPEVVMPVHSDELAEECLSYIEKRGLSIEDFKKIGALYVPSDYSELQKIISLKFSFAFNRLKDEGLYNQFKETLFSKNKEFTEQQFALIAKFDSVEPSMFTACRETYNLRGRIVFPVKIGNKNLGYVARDITGLSHVKAKNSIGTEFRSLFWNFNNVRNAREVVICEGIFSAISCGIDRSIALLGKNINPESDKIRLLKRLSARIFYIYLDTGAEKEAEQLRDILMNFAEEVHIIKIPPALKVQTALTDVELLQIEKLIPSFLVWERDKTYTISHIDQRAFKIAVRLLDNRLIPRNDEKLIPMARKLLKLDRNTLENIASGDFLDSNDLGIDFNNKIITKNDNFGL